MFIFGRQALRCCAGSLQLQHTGTPPVAACRLLISLPSLVVEHGFWGTCALAVLGMWAQFWLPGCGVQTQLWWHKGLVALRHVGSSRVSCIGRWIVYHWATGNAL